MVRCTAICFKKTSSGSAYRGRGKKCSGKLPFRDLGICSDPDKIGGASGLDLGFEDPVHHGRDGFGSWVRRNKVKGGARTIIVRLFKWAGN